MKSVIASMAAAVGLMIAGSAMALDMPPEASKNGCTSCHAIDKQVLGPAWADVGRKYAGQKTYKWSPSGDSKAADAKEMPIVEGLMKKVSHGGKGNWGTGAVMAANDAAGDKKQADIKKLVEFILSLK